MSYVFCFSHITENVYPKIFPAICEEFVKADKLVLTRCSQLESADNRQLGIDNKFNCDLSDAVCHIFFLLLFLLSLILYNFSF